MVDAAGGVNARRARLDSAAVGSLGGTVRAFVAIVALLVLAGAGAALWIRAEGEAPSLEAPDALLIGRAGGALAI